MDDVRVQCSNIKQTISASRTIRMNSVDFSKSPNRLQINVIASAVSQQRAADERIIIHWQIYSLEFSSKVDKIFVN